MKQTFTLLLVAILMIVAIVVVPAPADACEVPECQTLFRRTLDKLFEDNNIVEAEVTSKTEKIYDLNLNELGCIYDFTVNGTKGFAIMIYYDGQFEISEIYLEGQNPYSNCTGIKVYPITSVYLCYEEGNFYDLINDNILSEEALAKLSEISYMGGGDVVASTQSIYYTYKSQNDYWICYGPPEYSSITGINNICVPIAAGNLVGYWDRFKPNLMPNYEPGEIWMDEYFYFPPSEHSDNAIRQLATDMNVDTGTTVAEFKSGMKIFCNRAGYKVSFTKLMSWGSFSYNNAKNKILAGEPLIIFTQGFTVHEQYPKEGYDFYSGITSTGNHAMACFGYLDVSYTFSDGSSRTDNFLRVASGQYWLRSGYANVKTHKIDDAYSVKID